MVAREGAGDPVNRVLCLAVARQHCTALAADHELCRACGGVVCKAHTTLHATSMVNCAFRKRDVITSGGGHISCRVCIIPMSHCWLNTRPNVHHEEALLGSLHALPGCRFRCRKIGCASAGYRPVSISDWQQPVRVPMGPMLPDIHCCNNGHTRLTPQRLRLSLSVRNLYSAGACRPIALCHRIVQADRTVPLNCPTHPRTDQVPRVFSSHAVGEG